MRTEKFIAESAADAVAQIRAKLGPDAVVVDVRKQPASGLGRFLHKPQLEVLAMVPDVVEQPAAESAPAPVAKQNGDVTVAAAEVFDNAAPRLALPPESRGAVQQAKWRIEPLLESLGLLPLPAARLVEQLEHEHGPFVPEALAVQIEWARASLRRHWRPAPGLAAQPIHVFVGTPGAGKTACVVKWLTRAVLVEGRTAQVWRLDGRTANTAEWLSLHGEILGVAVERSWSGAGLTAEIGFVDLPGIASHDTAALTELAGWLAELPNAQVHLVLNAAYEASQLLAQVAAVRAALPVADLIVTHLDEEPRWGKLWNLILGTDFPIRFLGTGQNIPGDLVAAGAEALLERLFPPKSSEIGDAALFPRFPAVAGKAPAKCLGAS